MAVNIMLCTFGATYQNQLFRLKKQYSLISKTNMLKFHKIKTFNTCIFLLSKDKILYNTISMGHNKDISHMHIEV